MHDTAVREVLHGGAETSEPLPTLPRGRCQPRQVPVVRERARDHETTAALIVRGYVGTCNMSVRAHVRLGATLAVRCLNRGDVCLACRVASGPAQCPYVVASRVPTAGPHVPIRLSHVHRTRVWLAACPCAPRQAGSVASCCRQAKQCCARVGGEPAVPGAIHGHGDAGGCRARGRDG